MIDQALFAHLKADATLGPLTLSVSGKYRIYPMLVPPAQWDTVQMGAVVYSISGIDRGVSYCGTDKLVRTLLTIDCYHVTYTKVKALAAAVRAALLDYRGMLGGLVETRTANIRNELDLTDIEPGLFRVVQSWEIWHVET